MEFINKKQNLRSLRRKRRKLISLKLNIALGLMCAISILSALTWFLMLNGVFYPISFKKDLEGLRGQIDPVWYQTKLNWDLRSVNEVRVFAHKTLALEVIELEVDKSKTHKRVLDSVLYKLPHQTRKYQLGILEPSRWRIANPKGKMLSKYIIMGVKNDSPNDNAYVYVSFINNISEQFALEKLEVFGCSRWLVKPLTNYDYTPYTVPQTYEELQKRYTALTEL